MNRNNNQTRTPTTSNTGGTTVYVKNDDINGALRRLKRILEADNRQKDLSKHEFFEKKSVAKKRSRDQAKKRTQKEARSDIAKLSQKQSGVSWMKSKRKRRKLIDKQTLLKLEVIKLSKNKNKKR